MRITLLFLSAAMAVGCAYVQTAADGDKGPAVAIAPAPAGTVQPVVLLGPVTPTVKLTAKQRAYLDESLTSDVRKVLENAQSFEVFAEINKDESSETDSRVFVPNMVAVIKSEREKKEILEAFYLDAAHEDPPAVCYEPHHSLRATFEGRTIVIEICFDCSRFVVKDTKLWGTIVRENRRSEELLTRIVSESGVKIER